MNAETAIRKNRILVIDDNPAIHADFRKILGSRSISDGVLADAGAKLFDEPPPEPNRIEFEIDSAYQGEEGLNKLKAAKAATHPYAVAFVDVRMPPGWDGVETVARMWEDSPELQVVICTAYSDYSWEGMIGQLGMSDSLVILKKPFDNVEVLQLAHALTEKWSLNQQVKSKLMGLDQMVSRQTKELQAANQKLTEEVAERAAMVKALRMSEERFSKAFKASPIPLAIQSLRQETFLDANQGFLELTGYEGEELIGQVPEGLQIWADAAEKKALLGRLREEMSVRNMRCHLRAKGGAIRDVLVSVELFELGGEPFLLLITQDITEQIQLEEQLRQAQKLEAVGQLATGVAHDFNNILTVVQGNASLLLATRPPASSDCKPLQTICAAAERAAKLVQQLQTFCRKHLFRPEPVDLSRTLVNFAETLRRLAGASIAVNIQVPEDLPRVDADVDQLGQMLTNLGGNAQDAMPKGGTLMLSAEAIELSVEQARTNPDARPGRFVCIGVRDTGCGISSEILPRIFEPFFTTKPLGKGTGLGLATVYGIVKQHRGWIQVQSRPGQGTDIRVFLPVTAKRSGSPPRRRLEDVEARGESVLVVEQEAETADFLGQVLKSHGYTVFSANAGPQAMVVWAERKGKIDLLITDVVLAGGLRGPELAERLQAESPQLKVLYTSGRDADSSTPNRPQPNGRDFLAKPLQAASLLRRVRERLDDPAEEAQLETAEGIPSPAAN